MNRTPRQRGATLVEMMSYILLLLIIVTGATMALIGTLRGSARLSGRSDKVRESARMVRKLSTDLNDASFAILPTDSSSKRSWPLLAGNSRLFISNIQGSNGNGNGNGNGNSGSGNSGNGNGNGNGNSGSGSGETSLSTGVLATIPARYDLTLRDAGGVPVALNGSLAPLKRTTTAGGVLIYRGKPNGNPDSKKGTCLWLKKLSEDRQFSTPILLSDQLSREDNAVSFQINKDGLIQADIALQDSALGDSEANPISFTLELGNYTPTAGTQASTFLGGS